MFAYLCDYDYPNTKYWSLRLNPKMYSQGKLNLSNSSKIADLLLISILFDIHLYIISINKFNSSLYFSFEYIFKGW